MPAEPEIPRARVGLARGKAGAFERHPALPAGLIAILAATCLATPSHGASKPELVLTVGLPDRVRVNGLSQSPELTGRAFRWRGLDLKTRTVSVSGKDALVVEGRCVRLELGVVPGRYRVEAECCGVDSLSGPFALWINRARVERTDNGAANRLTAHACVTLEDEVVLPVGGAPIELVWMADVGRRVPIREVRVTPIDGATPVAIRSLLPLGLPIDPFAAAEKQAAPRDRLREVCEYLLRQQLSTGFFDYDSAAWWEAALASRCLLLGGRLLDEPRYLAAARRPLDFLLLRQEADGGFCANAYNPTTGAGSDPFTASPAPCTTRNVADLSAAAALLSVAAASAPDSVAHRYIAAQRRFVESFASRYRLPDGLYKNGLFGGKEQDSAYSVATATQTACLITLYRATDDAGYLKQAESTARALLAEWEPSGRPRLHAYDRTDREPVRPTQFHDLYYVLDALLWTRGATKDKALRAAIDQAFGWYINGSEGLLATLASSPGALRSGTQDDTKANAMVAILSEIRACLDEPKLDSLLGTMSAELLTPAPAERRGVLAFPYDEFGRKAVVASSFAGLSYAQLVERGSLFR